MNRKWAVLAGCVALSVLAVVPARAEDLKTYELKLEGPAFTPAELHVEAGKPFMLKFTNTNKGPAELESMDLKIEKIAPPGSSVMVKVQAVDKGSYSFVDEFQEDVAKGAIIAE